MPLHDDERFVAPLLWWEGRETARKNGGRCLPCRGDGAASCVNSIVGQDTRTVALSLPSSLTAGPDAEGNRGAGRSSRPLSPIHRRYEMSSRPVQYRNRSSVNCDPALGRCPMPTRRTSLNGSRCTGVRRTPRTLPCARWPSPRPPSRSVTRRASPAVTRTPTSRTPPTSTRGARSSCPGGGWRGYDPSQGLAVADRHVTVAAAANPRDAAPITGTFRGDGVVARLAAEIELDAVAP